LGALTLVGACFSARAASLAANARPNRRLGKIEKRPRLTHIDTSLPQAELDQLVERYTKKIRLAAGQPYHPHPGEFVLGTTLEFIKLPPDLAGRIEGRSSWGRLGLLLHATAGYIDSGFAGVLTFELLNAGRLPIALKPGLRAGQICFFKMSESSLIPYGNKALSKYAGATTVQVSRLARDPEIGPEKTDYLRLRDEFFPRFFRTNRQPCTAPKSLAVVI
jgi:dCTP deaminase